VAPVELLAGLDHFIDELAGERLQHRHILHDIVACVTRQAQ